MEKADTIGDMRRRIEELEGGRDRHRDELRVLHRAISRVTKASESRDLLELAAG